MLEKKMKTIFCAIHGYTHWEDCLVALINTPEFQRLKRIKQLAAVHHVFPCATHTRFEHSIGVGHLADLFAKRLSEYHKDLPINPLTFKLAGLCHDLGHGPLSHAYDAFLQSARSDSPMHEVRSTLMLRAIVRKYGIALDSKLVDDACELIAPQHNNLPLFWYQIIANDVDGIDVDKLDYLCRDSRNAGMPYRIDVQRFFEYARVFDDCLCYPQSMIPTIIHLVTVRHQLHTQVYQHRVVRALEHMYLDILRCFGHAAFDYESLTDTVFTREFALNKMYEGQIGPSAHARILKMIEDIETRNIYPCVFEETLHLGLRFEDLRSSLQALDEGRFVVDRLRIGYVEHPLFKVTFFDKNGKRGTLNPMSYCVNSTQSQEFVLRIYRRST